MTERPILFSGPMVRAILGGRKTQTRLVVKLPPAPNHLGKWEPSTVGGPGLYLDKACTKPANLPVEIAITHSRTGATVCCPYGVPGDRLWVREAWRPWSWREDNPITIEFAADGSRMEDRSAQFDPANYEEWYERIAVAATEECARKNVKRGEDGCFSWEEGNNPLSWRPSIFMPRWASRITLKITGVRVQRVQEITEEDAKAEGVDFIPQAPAALNHRTAYAGLWDSINAKRGFPWSSNPFVWAITFKRIEGGNPMQRTKIEWTHWPNRVPRYLESHQGAY